MSKEITRQNKRASCSSDILKNRKMHYGEYLENGKDILQIYEI